MAQAEGEEFSTQLEALTTEEPAASESPEAPAAPAAEPEGSTAQIKVPAKFLLPNAAAGCIIGKNGESITRIQAESEARLQLSRANEFFPGTNDRVLLISGTLKVVIAGLHFVLGKIQEEQVRPLLPWAQIAPCCKPAACQPCQPQASGKPSPGCSPRSGQIERQFECSCQPSRGLGPRMPGI